MVKLSVLSVCLVCCSPLMATTVFGPDPASYVATPGTAIATGVTLDGVVRITSDVGCSGALLFDGLHVLTAAHCVDGSITPGNVTVHFDMLGYNLGVSSITLAPGWSGTLGEELSGLDLAVLRLVSAATGVTGYNLYSGSSEVGSPIIIAGYGQSGTGATGADAGTYPYGTLRYGQNLYDATATGFAGGTSGVLMGDFDDGTALHDAFAVYASLDDLGFGADEISLAPGDSGGPSFLNGLLVGIHSFGLRLIGPGTPDVDGTLNSSFGEFFGDTRISSNAAWIEAQTTPEPGTFVLLGFGLAGLALRANRLRGRR